MELNSITMHAISRRVATMNGPNRPSYPASITLCIVHFSDYLHVVDSEDKNTAK